MPTKSLSQDLKFIRNYRFPLRGNCSDVIHYWITDYVEKTQARNLLSDADKQAICQFAKSLEKVYVLSSGGNEAKSKQLFFESMNSVKNQLFAIPLGMRIGQNIQQDYYRINKTNYADEWNYKMMLHVPITSPDLIHSNRYNPPQIPASYMSTSPLMAWCEAGEPRQFQMAKYIARDNSKKLLFLNLNPIETHQFITCQSINDPNNECLPQFCLQVSYTLPLEAVCSVSVTSDSESRHPEYILPQLLADWIAHDTDCVGICYTSSTSQTHLDHLVESNVVFPVNPHNCDSEGYDKGLQLLFDVKDKLSNDDACECMLRNFNIDPESTEYKKNKYNYMLGQLLGWEVF